MSEACGCEIHDGGAGVAGLCSIQFCPLHQNASQLLEAAKEILTSPASYDDSRNPYVERQVTRPTWEALCEAVASCEKE